MNVLIAFFFLMLSGLTAATPLKNIVVFGDSLSDNGNLYEYMHRQIPQSPPYFDGRFSNGPVWIERLAEYYFPGEGASHLLDYAFGGAGVSESDSDVLFTLKREIGSYLLAHEDKADENSLFVVWIGANNYLGIPDDVEQTIIDVNAGISNSIQQLIGAGAKHIIVVNLPDLGKTPVARLFDAEEELTEFSMRHNQTLENTINELQSTYKEVQLVHYDIYHMFNEILTYPEKYGFENIKDPCHSVMGSKFERSSVLKITTHIMAKTENCEGYLFFDPVHPSAVAHQLMADNARNLLTATGLKLGND